MLIIGDLENCVPIGQNQTRRDLLVIAESALEQETVYNGEEIKQTFPKRLFAAELNILVKNF